MVDGRIVLLEVTSSMQFYIFELRTWGPFLRGGIGSSLQGTFRFPKWTSLDEAGSTMLFQSRCQLKRLFWCNENRREGKTRLIRYHPRVLQSKPFLLEGMHK